MLVQSAFAQYTQTKTSRFQGSQRPLDPGAIISSLGAFAIGTWPLFGLFYQAIDWYGPWWLNVVAPAAASVALTVAFRDHMRKKVEPSSGSA
jgi:membrane protein implicated in regulation of membrane protease activity